MSISLKNKILFGFIINIIVVAALGLVSYKRAQKGKELGRLEVKHSNILLSATRSNTLLINNDNLSKSYVLTGDERYLNKLAESRHTALNELASLSSLLQSDPEQKKRMDKIHSLIGQRIQIVDQFIALRKQDKVNLAGDYLRQKSSIQSFDDVSKTLLDIQVAENLLYNKKKDELKATVLQLSIIFNGLLVSAAILLLVVYFIIIYQLNRRKESELLVECNDQLVRSIVDNANNPIFIKKINGEYLLINNQFQSLINMTNDQVNGKTDYDIFPRELADNLRKADIDVMSLQKEKTFEEQFPEKDGLHTFLVVKFPLFDNEKKIYAIGGIATDITEKAKSDLLQKENAVQFQTIWDSAPDAIVIINDEGKIIKWNPKAEGLFGWTADEARGKLMHETIIPEKFREKHLGGFKHFLETGQGPILNSTIEVKALSKKNNEFDIELSISAAKIKDRFIFIAFIREISERKLLQRKMEESEKFVNIIIENIPDIIFVKDTEDLRYIRLNMAAEKWMGVSRNNLLKKNNYDLFPKEQADFFTKTDRQILSTGELVEIPEEDADTKFGKRVLHTKKIPIKDETGKAIYLLGISEDITERKRLELEKNEADKMLRQSAQRIALILESIGEGVIVVDKEQRVILSNQKAEEVIGIKEDQTMFSSLDLAKKYELYYADGKTVFPSQDLPLTKALRGEQTRDVEIVIQDITTNEKKHVIVYGAPIRDETNAIVAGVTTIKDITSLKELAEELNLSEGKYRNLIGFKREEDKKGIVKGLK